ncbi:histidine kinase [Desulfitibacter alkalitolerans]|uniref:histidine kinase n=1 Tax=Desulfitibacter alkalitolerans TaxID=264641 RepID=UPI000489A0D7|nr:histidine kinase [Desulfitibacter alkalitolerans]
MQDDFVSRAPWSLQPSLKEMTEEVGIDFNAFIKCLKDKKNDSEMAQELGVSTKTIGYLKEHFEKYGVHSIVGQD